MTILLAGHIKALGVLVHTIIIVQNDFVIGLVLLLFLLGQVISFVYFQSIFRFFKAKEIFQNFNLVRSSQRVKGLKLLNALEIVQKNFLAGCP